MSEVSFTGERLHEGSGLFGVDLARHRAAYRYVLDRVGSRVVLELGSGSGYGAAELAENGVALLGIDRVAPDRANRRQGARFIRADLRALPLRERSFDWVMSFQVIEHLEDPEPYLNGIRRLLRPAGTTILTTPNVLTSDGLNPFHVHEYEADELGRLLGRHFAEVEMLGVGVTQAAARYFEARARNVQRILRLDPLRLRDRLPRRLVEWLFGRFAILVRRSIRRGEEIPALSWRDFPIGPVDPGCLDLLALCRRPR